MKNCHDPNDVRSLGGGIQSLGNLRNLRIFFLFCLCVLCVSVVDFFICDGRPDHRFGWRRLLDGAG
jgi:hypothetical protein